MKNETDIDEEQGKTEEKLESSIYQYYRWKVTKLQKQLQQYEKDEQLRSYDTNQEVFVNNDAQSRTVPTSGCTENNNDRSCQQLQLRIEKYIQVIHALDNTGNIDTNLATYLALGDIPGVLIGFYTFLKAHESDVPLHDEDDDYDDDDDDDTNAKNNDSNRNNKIISEDVTEDDTDDYGFINSNDPNTRNDHDDVNVRVQDTVDGTIVHDISELKQQPSTSHDVTRKDKNNQDGVIKLDVDEIQSPETVHKGQGQPRKLSKRFLTESSTSKKKQTKGGKLKQLGEQIDRRNDLFFAEKKTYNYNAKSGPAVVAKYKHRQEHKDEVIANLKEKLHKLQTKVRDDKNKSSASDNNNENTFNTDNSNSNDIGALSKRDAQWERRFQTLSEFIAKHGPDNLKLLHTQNPGLSDWVTTQRQCYFNKLPILTAERIERLNSINFPWTSALQNNQAIPFETRVKQCLQFKERYGHLTIPSLSELNGDGTEPSEDEKNFRLWAQKLRVKYKKRMVDGKKGALNPLLLRALDDIGFDWRLQTTVVAEESKNSPITDRFIDRVKQLQKVADVCGSCNDKKHILSVYPGNKSLLTWIQVTRRQYHKWSRGEPSTLTDERRMMLEQVGFDFNPRRHYAPPKTARYKNFKTLQLKDNGAYAKVPEKNEMTTQQFSPPPHLLPETAAVSVDAIHTPQPTTMTPYTVPTMETTAIQTPPTTTVATNTSASSVATSQQLYMHIDPTTVTTVGLANHSHLHHQGGDINNIMQTLLPVLVMGRSDGANGILPTDTYIPNAGDTNLEDIDMSVVAENSFFA